MRTGVNNARAATLSSNLKKGGAGCKKEGTVIKPVLVEHA